MAFRYSNFPDSIDDLKRLPEYQELSDEDKTYVGRYTELCQRGSSMTPQEKLEFNDLLNNKLKDKMIQSVDWNLLADAVTNCQDFFLNHVLKDISDMVNEKEEEFKNMTEEAKHQFTELVDNKDKKFTQMVDDKANEFNMRVDSFIDKGIYNNDTHYNKHNFIHYDDGTGVNVYIALKDTQGVSPSDDGTTWRKLTIKGDKGDTGKDGLNLVFKGAWSSKISYKFAHAVAYNGAIFVSIQEENLGNTPNELIDTEYWIKWKQVAIVTTKLKGIRKVVNNAKRVKFLGCGDIKAFNPDTDTLEVFKDTTALIEHLQYKIDEDNQTIVNLQGDWEGSSDKPVIFEFRVTRNQINDLVFGDGQSIQDGTITKNKLSKDIQESLDNIKENTEKINSIKEDTKATLEENNKKIDEKIQNFEKKISKINDGTILVNDGCRYKPFMSKGIKELNKFLISNVDEGVVDGNYLYAIDEDSNLLKINLESYKKEKEFRANRSGLYKINSDKKYIYTVGNESVYKIDKNNLNLIAECKLKLTNQTIAIILNDKYLYIHDRKNGEKICKIDKSTMEVVAQLDLKENYLRSIFEDKEFLYCTTSAKETQFLKINKQTLTISSTHEYQDNKACTILCVDENYIFAIDNKDKYILKINKNNGQILNKNENLIFKKYYNFTSYSNKNSLYLICADMIFEIDKKNLIVKSQSNYINEEKYNSTYFCADDESIYCFCKDIIYMFKSVYEIKYYEKIRGEE
ncbi:hypothetical protein G8S55_06815 [Clostridium botulinum C]|uniref:hypothetical protein n=1 Tax=Clostridium botulinum TaxID=1491 RepID=UPI001E2F1D77|nr:hypothetical protein [Clostridium botulinum]MCD3216964.1 hypothetical protein [Clostridium botulinum C]